MNDITPTHYRCLGIQPFQVMRADFSYDQYIGFLQGCILKRILRWQHKDRVQDLRKARHELDELIRFVTEINPDTSEPEAKPASLSVGDQVCFVANSSTYRGVIDAYDASSEQAIVTCKGERFVIPASSMWADKLSDRCAQNESS